MIEYGPTAVSSTRPEASPAPPARLGDYILLRRIGAGAVGDVWIAADTVGKLVAVKVIDRERLALISSKNREESALALLRTRLPEHPHLIRIHHVGNDGPRLFYVMDLADDAAGSAATEAVARYEPLTLARVAAAAAPLSPLDAVRIVRQLLAAVGCLHRAGAVHRDIKPSNVVCVGGAWKLADIGLLAADATELTTVGTPDFMPPSGPIDRSADLYALGKVLYCLATGYPARAFPRMPPELLRGAAGPALLEVNEVVTQACDPSAARRFRSAEDMDAALARCADRIEHRAGRAAWLTRRAALAAAGAGTAALALGGGWLWFRGRPWFVPSALDAGRWPDAADAATLAGASHGPGGSPIADASPPTPVWTPLFNGRDLTGWHTPHPHHGDWCVEGGAVRCTRSDEYKLLVTDRTFGPGAIRATILPDHDGARMGIGYLFDRQARGPLFMFMGDKYTWLRGYRDDYPPGDAGNWLSFPGPPLRAGGRATLEVEYGPRRVVLRVDGATLHELPGEEREGSAALHVWAGDAGAFASVEFLSVETV